MKSDQTDARMRISVQFFVVSSEIVLGRNFLVTSPLRFYKMLRISVYHLYVDVSIKEFLLHIGAGIMGFPKSQLDAAKMGLQQCSGLTAKLILKFYGPEASHASAAKWRRRWNGINRYRSWMIAVLILLSLILLFFNYLKYYKGLSFHQVDEILVKHSHAISKTVTLSKDFVTALGILVAAAWTYYLFVKGRMLKPRVKINTTLDSGQTSELVFLQFVIVNTGKTRVQPIRGVVDIYRVETRSGDVEDVLIHSIHDLLSYYLEPGEEVYLEPADDLYISVPVAANEFAWGLIYPNQSDPVFKVKTVFEAQGRLVWKTFALLQLNDDKEVPNDRTHNAF